MEDIISTKANVIFPILEDFEKKLNIPFSAYFIADSNNFFNYSINFGFKEFADIIVSLTEEYPEFKDNLIKAMVSYWKPLIVKQLLQKEENQGEEIIDFIKTVVM